MNREKIILSGAIKIAIFLITLTTILHAQEIKTLTYTDGGIYEGETKNDKREGRGTMTWPDGTQYVGDFKDDMKSGQGTYTWPNGDKYEGEWRDDERYGQGTMIWSDGRKYVGEWKNDKRYGEGTLTFPNGDTYEGEFKDNTLDGKGTYTYADGRKYVGDFKDDKFISGETIKPQVTENLIDKVAAVVNEDVITLSELKEIASTTNQNPEDTQVQSQVLELMIEERLLQQEAKKLGIQVTEKEIDAAVEEVKRRYNLTEEQMDEALKKQNLTPESFREQWRKQLLHNKLIGTQVQGQIAITEDEIKEYYEEKGGELESLEEIRIAHILITVESPDEEKQAENQALEIAKLAKSGEDFSELAKQFSKDTSSAERGGDLGYFKKGDMVVELEKAVIGTRIGEIVGPVRSTAGYHVIKVIDKKMVEANSLDNAKEEIRERIYQEKVEESIKAWLENVKKTAYIDKKI